MVAYQPPSQKKTWTALCESLVAVSHDDVYLSEKWLPGSKMILRFDSLGLSPKKLLTVSVTSLTGLYLKLWSNGPIEIFKTQQKKRFNYSILVYEIKGRLFLISWSTLFMTLSTFCFRKLSCFKFQSCNMIVSVMIWYRNISRICFWSKQVGDLISSLFLSLCVFVHACAAEAVMCLMTHFHCESSPISSEFKGWKGEESQDGDAGMAETWNVLLVGNGKL